MNLLELTRVSWISLPWPWENGTKLFLLNCDTLEYEYLPFETGDYVLAIINSNKQRTLADSKYNERFAECGAALKLLKKEIEATIYVI